MVVRLAQTLRMIRMLVRPAAPPLDWVAVAKTWIMGYPVGVERSSPRSPKVYRKVLERSQHDFALKKQGLLHKHDESENAIRHYGPDHRSRQNFRCRFKFLCHVSRGIASNH